MYILYIRVSIYIYLCIFVLYNIYKVMFTKRITNARNNIKLHYTYKFTH